MYTIKDVIDVLKSTRNCNLKCNDCILNKSIITNKIEKTLCWWLEETRKSLKLSHSNIEFDKQIEILKELNDIIFKCEDKICNKCIFGEEVNNLYNSCEILEKICDKLNKKTCKVIEKVNYYYNDTYEKLYYLENIETGEKFVVDENQIKRYNILNTNFGGANMFKYDDYVNLTNSLELPKEIRNKCVRVIMTLENMQDIMVVHKFKTYVVNEKYIGKVA
ncbi:hypothetical protein NMJ53_012475 [Clostridioides difficile]|nr:hypothetical protein [Clostridioides difficile]EIS9524100.1 hypothetical protein [Clostridioides difficile]EIS9625677.1 hypothetical protein [Clostridioides difficile]MBZ0630909.1 hypothetical protein [Clostridioides difficile]MBZ0654892.1 hypothetical protein [Clostridioides difficile]